MLKLSEDTVDALRTIGALRITGQEVEPGEVEIEIDAAEEPLVDDQVVEQDGVAVYLDPVAANVLEDQVLEVEAHGDHFHFGFSEQEDASAAG
jgi:Fe-S cluster assembly iron-binding protein IscA